MALYSLSAQLIGGHQQLKSCVAAAAYRAGERLYDECLLQTHDYTEKRVEYSEILVPDGAPEWARHREQLWNMSELCRTRMLGVTARELRIALPRELDRPQQLELVRTFLRDEFVSLGMVADWSLHDEPGKDQPHVHVMLSVRELHADGFGKRVFEWDKKRMLYRWREAWAHHANRALERAGCEERIDHRSYAARGINIRPQPKLYRHHIDTQLDDREMVHDRMAKLLRVQRENGERIKLDPTIPIRMLTEQRATFRRDDLLRFLNVHTVDDQQFDECLQAVMASPELVELRNERFTSREMLQAERRMMAAAKNLSKAHNHRVSEQAVAIAASTRPTISDEQKRVLEYLTRRTGDLALVEGYAGTGKSFLLGAAREAWEAEGLTVLGGALAGKAADGLEVSSGIESRTLASWELAWSKGKHELTAKHVLVIDEVGMLGTRQLGRVLEKAREARAKVVLVGDSQQLQAIEAGAPFRKLIERFGSEVLTEVRRQRIEWQRDATKAFATGEAKRALAAYEEHGLVKAQRTSEGALKALIASWAKGLEATPIQEQIIMAYRRDDVRELNERAREIWRAKGALGQEHEVITKYGTRAFAIGDRMYIGQNDRELGVKRGMLGTLESIRGDALTVRLDGQERRVTFDLRTYAHLDYGYAITVHKSQGATVDRAYVLASKLFEASTCYVAMSRHRDHVELYWARDEFGTQESLERTLCRHNPKDLAIEHLEIADVDALEKALRTAVKREPDNDSLFFLLPRAEQQQQVELHQHEYAELCSKLTTTEKERRSLLQGAEEAQKDAQQRYQTAVDELERYQQLGWVEQLKLGLSAEKVRHEHVDRAKHDLLEATRELDRQKRDPDLQRKAEDIAGRHNTRFLPDIHRAKERIRRLEQQMLDSQKQSLLEVAFDSIRKKYAGELRHAAESDLGRPFKVVATAKLGTLDNGQELHCALLVAEDGSRVIQPLEAYQAASLRTRVGQKVEIAQNALGRVELNLWGPGFDRER